MTTTRQTTTAPAAVPAETLAWWAERPERLVTLSTGVVHVALRGTMTMCGTRTAVRTATTGTTPTCRLCGAPA